MNKAATQSESTVRFTIDLSASMHRELSILAAMNREPKANLVRQAITRLLQEHQASQANAKAKRSKRSVKRNQS